MNTIRLWPALRAGLYAGALWVFTWGSVAQEIHDNVIIVLDSSGSMASPMPGSNVDKMTAAKAALRQVLQQLPANVHVGLLVFSSRDLKNDWVYPLGPRDEAKLLAAVDLPQPGHGTPLGRYIKKGADRLLQERVKQFGYGSYRLLVVTDGEAEDPQLVDRFTPDVIARGITVDVIGVAMNRRHTLATKVHSYRSASDPAALKRALAEVFAEVGSSKDDVAHAEAFALLEPIPAELAKSAIQALSVSGNHPIGERPPPAPTPSPARSAASPTPPQPPAPSAPPVPAQPSPPLPPPSSRPSRADTWIGGAVKAVGGLFCCGSVGLVALVLMIRALKKGGRR